jgi:Fe-S-cluster containining protein
MLTLTDRINDYSAPLALRLLALLESAEGELFECKRCGSCCQLVARITLWDRDIYYFAKYFNISIKLAKKRFTRVDQHTPTGLSIKKTRPCMFYDFIDKSCKIYPVRPLVCRLYPFGTLIDLDDLLNLPDNCPMCKEFDELYKAICHNCSNCSDMMRSFINDPIICKQIVKFCIDKLEKILWRDNPYRLE